MKNLATYIVTFNCARTLVEPEHFSKHLFDSWKNPVEASSKLPDVVVLNLQEVAPVAHAFTGGSLVKPYFDRLRKSVDLAAAPQPGEDGVDYFNVLSKNAGLTAIMVFVRDDIADQILSVNLAHVGVGIQQMGNKGAIGARIGWRVDEGQPPLYTTFVSAHLAPFEEEIERRNQDYVNIVRRMVFVGPDARELKSNSENDESRPLLENDNLSSVKDSKETGMYADDAHLFFAGDLNYRTALTGPSREDVALFPQPTTNRKAPEHYCHLLEKDQLSQELHSNKTLHGLQEQSIDFCPTYKYHDSQSQPVLQDEDMDKWPWAKHRWPSWCDRIFFSSVERPAVVAGQYDSLPLFRTSDHRPVALSVSIPYKTVETSSLSSSMPAPIDSNWRSQRDIARRKELAVGLGAYLGTTWEGNTVLFGALLVILSGFWLSKSVV